MAFPTKIDVVVNSPAMPAIWVDSAGPDCEWLFNMDTSRRAGAFPVMGDSAGASRHGVVRNAVIQVSEDGHLARSRSLLLQSVGFSVYTYSSAQAGRMLLSTRAFAIFLCQTVPVEVAFPISHAMRNLDPSVLLVRATHAPDFETEYFNRVLHAPVQPKKLTREMLGLRSASTWDGNSR